MESGFDQRRLVRHAGNVCRARSEGNGVGRDLPGRLVPAATGSVHIVEAGQQRRPANRSGRNAAAPAGTSATPMCGLRAKPSAIIMRPKTGTSGPRLQPGAGDVSTRRHPPDDEVRCNK